MPGSQLKVIHPSAKTENLNRLTREGQGHHCTGGLGSVWKTHRTSLRGFLYISKQKEHG